MPEELEHSALVHAWMERAAAGHLSSERLLALFEDGFGAMWRRAHVTLGDVTLMAVVDRVLYNASERFPAFSSLQVGPAGLLCETLREQISTVEPDQLESGIQFILIEFLTVLGNLTSEILTPALHAELSKVGTGHLPLEDGARSERAARKSTAARRRRHEK